MKTNRLFPVLLFAMAAGFISCAPTQKEDPEAVAAKERVAMMDKNKIVTQKIFTAFESNVVDSLVKYLADNMVDHNPAPGGSSTGPQSQKDVLNFYHPAFPDMKLSIISMVAEDNMVSVHFNFKGTNSGPLGTMPATNKPVDVNAVEIFRMENGKVAERWLYYEEGKMMAQMNEPKVEPKKK